MTLEKSQHSDVIIEMSGWLKMMMMMINSQDCFLWMSWEMQDHANVSCCLSAGCAMSGLIADAKTLIDKARVETQVSARLCLTSSSDIEDR